MGRVPHLSRRGAHRCLRHSGLINGVRAEHLLLVEELVVLWIEGGLRVGRVRH